MSSQEFDDLKSQLYAENWTRYINPMDVQTVHEVSAREKLFLAVNLVGKVRDHLHTIVTDGKLAAAELREIVAVAERKKSR